MQITLKQTMSSHPMTVRYKDDLNSAYIRMKREGYRHLPVIDERGVLVGLISDHDFQRAMGPKATADAHGLPDGPTFPKGAKVSEYMSKPAITLPDDTELLYAVKVMIYEKISAIAITNDGNIVGVITHEDLLRVLAVHLQEPTTLKDKAFVLAYNSPLGKISDLLSAVGI